MDERSSVEREEIEAALEVRRELGPAYEAALVDSFAERVEAAIEAGVDRRLAEQEAQLRHSRHRDGRQFSLAVTSLALGIPLTAISGAFSELSGVVVTWVGICTVNIAYAWQNRGRGRRD